MTEEALPPQGVGLLNRLSGSLLGEKEVFADIAARPRGWWVPLVLLAVLTAGYTLAYSERVGWERFLRQELERSPQAQQLSAEQREQAVRQQIGIVSILAPVQAVLIWPILTLILAGAFVFVFNVLLGAQLTFRQFYALTCYSVLPFAVSTVLAIVLLFLTNPAEFDLRNPIASNVGAFLDPGTSPAWLVSLGSSIDAFSVWALLLLATGFSTAARRLAWSKAFTWVVATWVVWLVVKGGWTWIWS